MKKAAIVGLGNALEGDYGIAYYLLETLAQEHVEDSVYFDYLGDIARHTDIFLYQVDFAVVISALNLGGPAGHTYCWDYGVFRQHAEWIACESIQMKQLWDSLSRLELFGGLPAELFFLWIVPKLVEGFQVSKEVRKAMWKGVRIVKGLLCERGFLPERSRMISRISGCQSLRVVSFSM